MSVKTYDPKQVAIIVAGSQISGYANGSFIKVERDEDAFSKVTGADGYSSRAKSNNRGGVMTVTLAQTSDSNDILNAFALADEVSNAGVVPVMMKDNSGRTTIFSGFAWVKKTAGADFAKEIGNREWIFDMTDVDINHGGNF